MLFICFGSSCVVVEVFRRDGVMSL
ncbi:hypothetical protein HID58_079927 [Brassica napus]|uniref:Uncharacterized protein n=1 Tax=Brassica napus TaxID=3708 RepID=A0ABQ7Y3H4_BRANA|nr:hypothetical protein HID58_079927 [Brassica napus]